MKVKLNKPAMVRCLPGEIEVTRQEYERLLLLGLIEPNEKAVQDIQKVVNRKKK